jgi:alpha-ribazole phosphatase
LSKLLLVRHGRTKLHKDDRFWGKTDVALGDIGIRQAEQLHDRLAKEKIHTVYASALSRARTTAEIIISNRRLTIATREELDECNFGYVEGLTFEEITDKYPDLASELNRPDYCLRFPGGESFEELDHRVIAFLEKLDRHKTKENILIVAHGGTLRLLICHLLGIDVKHWHQFRLDLASVSIVETYSEGAILNLMNDVSHLKS